MKIDVDRLVEAVAKQHMDYIGNDDIPPAQMFLERDQHVMGKCFPTCFFCKIDRTAAAEILKMEST